MTLKQLSLKAANLAETAHSLASLDNELQHLLERLDALKHCRALLQATYHVTKRELDVALHEIYKSDPSPEVRAALVRGWEAEKVETMLGQLFRARTNRMIATIRKLHARTEAEVGS